MGGRRGRPFLRMKSAVIRAATTITAYSRTIDRSAEPGARCNICSRINTFLRSWPFQEADLQRVVSALAVRAVSHLAVSDPVVLFEVAHLAQDPHSGAVQPGVLALVPALL